MNTTLTVINDHTIQCGPFTWRRVTRQDVEIWEPVFDREKLGLTYFVVKNYGEKHTDFADGAFSGWRVVSGGPFTDAGKWSNRDEAIKGATRWLVNRYKHETAEAVKEALEKQTALTEFLNDLKGEL